MLVSQQQLQDDFAVNSMISMREVEFENLNSIKQHLTEQSHSGNVDKRPPQDRDEAPSFDPAVGNIVEFDLDEIEKEISSAAREETQ